MNVKPLKTHKVNCLDVAVSMRKSQKQIGLRYDVTYDGNGLLTMEYCAKTWRTFINAYRPYINDSRCHLVKYEELVTKPEIILQKICEFLHIDYEPSMLNFNLEGTNERTDLNLPHLLGVKKAFYQESVHQWKNILTPEEVKIFEQYASAELKYMGYSLSTEL